MKMSANPFIACVDVLMSPTTAFTTVKDKKAWSWVPFILLLGTTFAVFMYYFAAVDFEWLKEHMAANMAATGQSEEAIEGFTQNISLSMLQWSTVIGAVVVTLVMNLIVALYYYLATKVVSASEYKYGDWLGFTWWVGMPTLVSLLVSILVISFAANGQVALEDLQPTSLNSLIFSLDVSSPWYGFLSGINIFAFWALAIASIGLKAWTNIESKKATLIAIMPFVLIYGIWALYIAFTA